MLLSFCLIVLPCICIWMPKCIVHFYTFLNLKKYLFWEIILSCNIIRFIHVISYSNFPLLYKFYFEEMTQSIIYFMMSIGLFLTRCIAGLCGYEHCWVSGSAGFNYKAYWSTKRAACSRNTWPIFWESELCLEYLQLFGHLSLSLLWQTLLFYCKWS